MKDVPMCKLVKLHSSITVSSQCLNMLMMREGERGWWGETQEKEQYEGQKKSSSDSRKLTTKLIQFDSHHWLRPDSVRKD